MTAPESNSQIIIPLASTSKRWTTPILYPDNLEALRGDLGRANFWAGAGVTGIAAVAISPLAALAAGVGSLIAGSTRGADPNIAAIAKQMNFVPAAQHARIELAATLTATKFTSSSVTLAFVIRLSFEVDRYLEDDKTGVIYQDILRFECRHYRDPSTENPDSPLGSPAMYETYGTTWRMSTATYRPLLATQDVQGPYDPDDPMSLVRNEITTKWLKDPEAGAMGRVEFQSIFGYPIPEARARGDFDVSFAIAQRVMYARVVGRSGLPGLKVGGVGVIVPAFFLVQGNLRVDFTNRTISIRDDTQQFQTFSG